MNISCYCKDLPKNKIFYSMAKHDGKGAEVPDPF